MTEENLEVDVSTQDEPELLAITSTTQDESDSELLAITSTNDEGEIIVGENETKLDKTTNCENSVVEDIPTDDDNKNRKRKHEEDEENDEKQEQETQIAADTTSDNIDDEPKTKKAALDRLRNMKFSVKDPFKDNPPKERPTFIRSTKHNSRKSSIDEESTTKTSSSRRNSRSRLDDDSSYRSRRRHRSRSRNGNNERHRGEENSSSMDKLIESRHQRSTMYFLQKDKSKYGISSSPQKQQQINNRSSNIPIKPIQERIDALLARPDYEVLAMPVADLRALILQGVELFREQNNFLSAKKTLLSELESLIYAEREEIERLSQEVQTSYRPPPEELVVQKQQQLPEQQKVLDFSIPPPNIMTTTTTNVVSGIDGGISSTSNICGGINNNNEFSTPPPNFSQPPPQQQQILSSSSTLQFNNNINSQPTTILSSSSTSSQQSLILGGGGSSPFSHFSQTPSLLYPSTPSKLIQQQQLNICVSSSNVVDVSSKITELIKTSISLPNTSFPPPKLLLETSRPHSNPNFSVNRLVTTTSTSTNQQLPPLPSLSSSFFSVPPPQIFINKQSEQQQQTVVTSSIIPSLLRFCICKCPF